MIQVPIKDGKNYSSRFWKRIYIFFLDRIWPTLLEEDHAGWMKRIMER